MMQTKENHTANNKANNETFHYVKDKYDNPLEESKLK